MLAKGSRRVPNQAIYITASTRRKKFDSFETLRRPHPSFMTTIEHSLTNED